MNPTVLDPGMIELYRLRARRSATVIVMVVVAELALAGLAIDVAAAVGPGLTTATTVSVEGATGTWVLAQSVTAAVPVVPSAPETTASTPVPVDEPGNPSEPKPTNPQQGDSP